MAEATVFIQRSYVECMLSTGTCLGYIFWYESDKCKSLTIYESDKCTCLGYIFWDIYFLIMS